jgi:hypothetical protein
MRSKWRYDLVGVSEKPIGILPLTRRVANSAPPTHSCGAPWRTCPRGVWPGPHGCRRRLRSGRVGWADTPQAGWSTGARRGSPHRRPDRAAHRPARGSDALHLIPPRRVQPDPRRHVHDIVPELRKRQGTLERGSFLRPDVENRQALLGHVGQFRAVRRGDSTMRGGAAKHDARG